MLVDIGNIMWKEWREFLSQCRHLKVEYLTTFCGVLLVGIIPALENGAAWMSSPLVLVFSGWVPIFLVSAIIADSFAGERERHTLLPLLATPISDLAILLGKILAAVVYGLIHTLLMLIVQQSFCKMA